MSRSSVLDTATPGVEADAASAVVAPLGVRDRPERPEV